MPIFSSKLELSSAASASGVALADVQFIKGAFYSVKLYTDLVNIPTSRISDKQIVWVEDAATTYQASVTSADFITTFEDTVSWAEFTGFGGGGASAGDITSVIAGSGLTGGTFSGAATLNVGAGNGITVSADAVSINTGSAHFTSGVEYIISSGSFTIDAGRI